MKRFKDIIDCTKRDEYLYLLKNKKEYYIGQTTNLARRLSAHQSTGFNFTKYSSMKVYYGEYAERQLMVKIASKAHSYPDNREALAFPRYYASEDATKMYFSYYYPLLVNENRKYNDTLYWDRWCDICYNVEVLGLDTDRLYTIHWNSQNLFSRFTYDGKLDKESFGFPAWNTYKKKTRYIGV
tara:strand:+ start:48 stop:596 length:549 start_codon:yes stop_codon:yes gene_type:complete